MLLEKRGREGYERSSIHVRISLRLLFHRWLVSMRGSVCLCVLRIWFSIPPAISYDFLTMLAADIQSSRRGVRESPRDMLYAPSSSGAHMISLTVHILHKRSGHQQGTSGLCHVDQTGTLRVRSVPNHPLFWQLHLLL